MDSQEKEQEMNISNERDKGTQNDLSTNNHQKEQIIGENQQEQEISDEDEETLSDEDKTSFHGPPFKKLCKQLPDSQT